MLKRIKYSSIYAESWNVAIRRKPHGTILSDVDTQFKIINNNYYSWVADPFLFSFNGVNYVFAEMYDYNKLKGTICYGIIKNNNIIKWKQIIVENEHLSYPFVFEHNNEVYIIPESSESKTLCVYKAIDFPNKWERIKILENDVNWVDTTLFEYEGNYYAFTTDVTDYQNQKHFLLTLNKNGITSKYQIDSNDSKTSRMAGKLLIKDNLYKVCQDCRKTYGGGIIFKCINKNDLDGKNVVSISAKDLNLNKNIICDGIHTYNGNNEYEIIDIKTRRFNLINLVNRIINKIKK